MFWFGLVPWGFPNGKIRAAAQKQLGNTDLE